MNSDTPLYLSHFTHLLRYDFGRLHVDNKTGLLIGAHLVRHNAAEVINVFALAIANKIPAEQLADFLWAYPTFVSDIKYMVG